MAADSLFCNDKTGTTVKVIPVFDAGNSMSVAVKSRESRNQRSKLSRLPDPQIKA